MRDKLRRVRKEDFNRVILTETLPYEVPIIFSNFGLYSILKKIESETLVNHSILKFILKKKDPKSYSIPLTYKIRKDKDSFRKISLLHPISQIEFIDLYRDFSLQIVNACQKSNYSLRKPSKVASKYYIKNINTNKDEYKSDQVSSEKNELNKRFLASYFSYSKYTRMYHFYNSFDFIELEKKYSSFYTLDIARCFDSIYTHSITWALKTKYFSKNHTNIHNTLGSTFDRAMQSANFNETAGIVIGPEVSRIFSEIILQEIDKNIEESLNSINLTHGKHYDIRRYVDDILIFTLDEKYIEPIISTIEHCLSDYKFTLNKSKTHSYKHPFVTNKTKSLVSVKASLQKLHDNLIENTDDKNYRIKKIIRKKNLKINFLNEIKSACINDGESYDLACSFITSSLSKSVSTQSNYLSQNPANEDIDKIRCFFEILISLIFHFFTVSPTHSSSINICRVIHTSCDFFEKHIKDEENFIKTHIYSLCIDFFESSKFSDLVENQEYCPLETLNIICSMRRLGCDFKLSEKKLTQILPNNKRFSYFETICILYYIEKNTQYINLKSRIIKNINQELSQLNDIRENTVKCYLLFDVISCPYIDLNTKQSLAFSYLKLADSGTLPSTDDAEKLIREVTDNSWFATWDEANLLYLLEKKELLRGY